MVAMIIYGKNDKELIQLKALSKDLFALLSEEELELNCTTEDDAIRQEMESGQLLDLACVKVACPEDVELLRDMRRTYAQVEILIIADREVSPMMYMTPDIRAASLLLYPYQSQECRQVMKDFFHSFFQGREQLDEKKALVIQNRDGKIAIPYIQIYYIEIRERKVFVRLKDKEYSLYDSLERIIEKLPEVFIRCHRSFVFNTQHLEAVKLSENIIYLEHDITVPLSRSYKPEVKEYVKGLHIG